MNPAAGLSPIRTAPGSTVTFCGAAWSITPASAGKNQASRTVAADSPLPSRLSVPSGATWAVNGDGRGCRAAPAANNGASSEGDGVPGGPGGKNSLNVPSSGTQIFSHTSQVALASMAKPPAAGMTVTGNTISPV